VTVEYEYMCEADDCKRESRSICIHAIPPYFHPECFEAQYGVPISNHDVIARGSDGAVAAALANRVHERHPAPGKQVSVPAYVPKEERMKGAIEFWAEDRPEDGP
jgi:hypothetical protein